VQVVHLGQDAVGVLEHEPPLRRDLDPARGAAEDLDAELELEPADLLGDRGLGEVQLLARLGEGPVAGHGGDAAQVTELHGPMVPSGRAEVEAPFAGSAITWADG
jgi:hypothetical protein